MFGMHSGLCPDKWDDKGSPPDDIESKGYKEFEIARTTEVNVKNQHLTVYLISDDLNPTGQIYGVIEHPLRSISHCWMKFQEKARGLIITGIAIEGDWVEMKSDYLKTFPEIGEEDNEEDEEEGLKIIGNFSEGKWETKGLPPKDKKGKQDLGFHEHSIVRVIVKKNKIAECFVKKDNKGFEKLTILQGVERNPFKDIENPFLKMKMRAGKPNIIGIIQGEEWIEMKL